MKLRYTLAVSAAAMLVAITGCSQHAPGFGRADAAGPGPGMMYGYGPGDGWGPGMMGGGWGPGGGMGMGPGMMGGGAPGYGMGPGMMGGVPGYGWLPDLTGEQQAKIADIQRDYANRQWPLMQQMHSLMWGSGARGSGVFDEDAARRNYDAMAALQKQMFENRLAERKQIDAVLTPQQRDELQRRWGRR